LVVAGRAALLMMAQTVLIQYLALSLQQAAVVVLEIVVLV
jgi:hypothetical protein